MQDFPTEKEIRAWHNPLQLAQICESNAQLGRRHIGRGQSAQRVRVQRLDRRARSGLLQPDKPSLRLRIRVLHRRVVRGHERRCQIRVPLVRQRGV